MNYSFLYCVLNNTLKGLNLNGSVIQMSDIRIPTVDNFFNFGQKKSGFRFFFFLAYPCCHIQLPHEQDPRLHLLPPLQTIGHQIECTSCGE